MSNFRIHFFSVMMVINITLLYVDASTFIFVGSLILIFGMWLDLTVRGVKK